MGNQNGSEGTYHKFHLGDVFWLDIRRSVLNRTLHARKPCNCFKLPTIKQERSTRQDEAERAETCTVQMEEHLLKQNSE
jgi:hypothetical protein